MRLVMTFILAASVMTVAALAADLPAPLRNVIPTPQEIEATGGRFHLVHDGQASAPIVVPDDPPDMVRLAAEYLAERVEELVGVALAVLPAAQVKQLPTVALLGAGGQHTYMPWQQGLSAAQQ